jgi:hypothetical protein
MGTMKEDITCSKCGTPKCFRCDYVTAGHKEDGEKLKKQTGKDEGLKLTCLCCGYVLFTPCNDAE